METRRKPAGRVLAWLGRLAGDAGLALGRFPLASVAIIAAAIVSSLAIEDIYLTSEARLPYLLASLYAGAAVAVAATLAGETREWTPLHRHGLAVTSGLVVGALVWFAPELGVYPPSLVAAATFAVPLAPFAGRGDSRRFWVFGFWTAVGIVLAFISVLMAVAGLSAVLEMIRYLFGIGLPSAAYGHVFTAAFVFVGPLFALGRIPTSFEEDDPFGSDPRLIGGVRLLIDRVAAPLTLLVALMLHLYAAKIALEGDLPSGEIGWIVMFFAIFILSFRIAVDPFVETGAATTRMLARTVPLLLIVPLILLAAATCLRISTEGVTVERYFLALGILAASLAAVAQAPRSIRGDLRVIAAIPMVLLALGSVGPLGAAAVTGASQTGRVVEAFGGEITAGADPDAPDRKIVSRLRVLAEIGETHRLRPHLSPELVAGFDEALRAGPHQAVDYLETALGLRATRLASPSGAEPGVPQDAAADVSGTLDLSGLDRARLGLVIGETSPFGESGDAADISVALDGNVFIVSIAGTRDRFEASPPSGEGATSLRLMSVLGRSVVLAAEEPGPWTTNTRIALFWSSAEWQD